MLPLEVFNIIFLRMAKALLFPRVSIIMIPAHFPKARSIILVELFDDLCPMGHGYASLFEVASAGVLAAGLRNESTISRPAPRQMAESATLKAGQ